MNMRWQRLAWLLLLLLPLLWLAPILCDPAAVHYAPGAAYSDLAVTHLPNAEFLRQTLADYGEIPLWNPHILGGTPFAGDPLSGLYYPPLWLALLLPGALAFNILFLAHLALAGIGAYRLARAEGFSPAGSLLAGIAFGGMPKLAAHVSAGHLTLVLAVCWTPWLLLAARAAARGGGFRKWALAGGIAGLVFLADPRWALPAGLAALAYAAVTSGGVRDERPRLSRMTGALGNILVFGGFALGISAALAVPMAEFVSLSSRANLLPSDAIALSLPPQQLLGLLFAGAGGSAEWMIYPGAVVLLLAFFPSLPIASSQPREPAGTARSGGKGRFWIFLFLLCILLSLGSFIPGMQILLGAVPGVNLLRVPPRWMFLAGLARAMLAARGVTALEESEDRGKAAAIIAVAIGGAGVALAGAGLWMRLPQPLWTGGLVWSAAGWVIFLVLKVRPRKNRLVGVLLLLACADLALADIPMISARPAGADSADAQRAAEILAAEGGDFRVYSPSYSLPQGTAVKFGLRMLDGVNPLILKSTVEVVAKAARVPMTGYSVTLPAFATGNPAADNAGIIPDWVLLRLLNVRYIVSGFEIPSPMTGAMRRVGGLYLYENLFVRPRAWVAESLDAWDRPVREARVESGSPNRLRIHADGPGTLVLSEAGYPAWRASVDGIPAEIRTAGGWWRAVEIGAGEHTVEMWIEPPASWIGLGITLLALGGLAGVWRWAR